MNPEYTEEAYGDELQNIPASNKDHQPISVVAEFFAPAHATLTKPDLAHTASVLKNSTNPRCQPLRFTTETGREVEITEIGLVHPKYNGLKTLFLFDVTDGSSDYRLSFDTETLEWFLEWEGDQYV